LKNPASKTILKAGLKVSTTASTSPTAAGADVVITAKPISSLEFTNQPTVFTVAKVFSSPIQVALVDANGNPSTVTGVSVVLSKIQGTGALTGTLIQATVAGVATFTDLKIDAVGAYILGATATGYSPALSAIVIQSAVTATKLAFTSSPPNSVQAGVTLTVTVKATDAAGKTNPDQPGSAVLATSPIFGLRGSLVSSFISGTASFSVYFTKAGTYNLTASASLLTTATQEFTVTEPELITASGSVTINDEFVEVKVSAFDSDDKLVASTILTTITKGSSQSFSLELPATGSHTIKAQGFKSAALSGKELTTESSPVSVSEATSSLSLTLDPPPIVSAVSFTPSSTIAGAPINLKVSFQDSAALATGNKITITTTDFVVPTTGLTATGTGFTTGATFAVASTATSIVVTVTGTAAANTPLTLTISGTGLKNPASKTIAKAGLKVSTTASPSSTAASADVVIAAPIPITIGSSNITVNAGFDTFTTVEGQGTITATSSDTAIATVAVDDGKIVVTGASAGTVTVTVRDDSSSTTFSVTVGTPAPLENTSLASTDGEAVSAKMSVGVSSDGGNTFGTTFTTTDKISLFADISPDTLDVGTEGELGLVATINDTNYQLDEGDNYIAWDGSISSLVSFESISALSAKESVAKTYSLPAGSYRFFFWYKGEGKKVIIYNTEAVEFTVEEASGGDFFVD
jgi:hypothetical protein